MGWVGTDLQRLQQLQKKFVLHLYHRAAIRTIRDHRRTFHSELWDGK